jgi:hypothetical protein
MNITITEFLTQIRGARALGWQRLKIEGWLWESFTFSDTGAHYLNRYERYLNTGDQLGGEHGNHR